MINYNELFNVVYSTEIPESVKLDVLDRIPLEEDINESVISEEALSILEVLNILTYSDIDENKVSSVIDEVFSSLSEELVEEIAEKFIKEKCFDYLEILEDIAHGTDAIGLKQALADGSKARRDRIQQKWDERKSANARKQAISNTITKARKATEKAIHKGAELYDKGRKLNKDIKANIASKGSEFKTKAINSIKGAVGKVKDWAKNIGTDNSPIGLVQAIGKKAIENEKAGKPNFKSQNSSVKLKQETPKVEGNTSSAKQANKETNSGQQKLNLNVNSQGSTEGNSDSIERLSKQIEELRQRRAETTVRGEKGKLDTQIKNLNKLIKASKKSNKETNQKVTNEALTELAILLTKTNISESAFVEIMTISNPIKDKRKDKFKKIVDKKLRKKSKRD